MRVDTLVLAGLVGLFGLEVWPGDGWLSSMTSHASAPVVISPAPEMADRAKPKKEKLVHGRIQLSPGDHLSVNSALAEENRPMSSVVVEVPIPVQPNDGDLHPGITRATLRERYGEPMLDVTSRREGRLIERYYYVARDRNHLTVATLQDGKVVSTEAMPY